MPVSACDGDACENSPGRDYVRAWSGRKHLTAVTAEGGRLCRMHGRDV